MKAFPEIFAYKKLRMRMHPEQDKKYYS